MSKYPITDAAFEALALHIYPVPVVPGTKKPGTDGYPMKDWEKLRLSAEDLQEHFSNGNMIGWLLGIAPQPLADIDVDCREALALSEILHPPSTERISGHKSKPRSHYFYIVSEPFNGKKFLDTKPNPATDKPDTLIELRGAGQQTVVPPSIHQSGEPIIWYAQGKFGTASHADLLTYVKAIAAGALLVRHWPTSPRHEARWALSSVLLRNRWDEDRVLQFVQAVVAVAQPGDRAAFNKVATDIQRFKQLKATGQNTIGLPRLCDLVGQKEVSYVAEWLGINVQPEQKLAGANQPRGEQNDAPEAESADWPEAEPLGQDLPPVPAFKIEMLPESFRSIVQDVAERMQVPVDLPAADATVALAGVVNRRAVIQPKKRDTGWKVIANLWGLTVALPGMLKSPVMHAITSPLSHIEGVWRDNYEHAKRLFEDSQETGKLDYQVYCQRYKKAQKKGDPVPDKPARKTQPPIRRRLLVSDATPEKLQEILADNPAGVMVLRDELSGLIAEMDKEGREQERAFYLQAWNGYGHFTVDRIGRDLTHIPNVCLSLLGNVQPARLRSYLSETLEGGPGDDGLLQRFQVLVWPDPVEYRRVDRAPDNAAIARAEKVFSHLANLPTESIRLRFAPDAQEIFDPWLDDLEVKVRPPHSVGMHPALVAHLAKYRSLMPSLAGLFELADLAAADQPLDDDAEIGATHTLQAVKFCAYLEAHARRVYSCITQPELHAARELGAHIQRGAVPNKFTARDVYKREWAALRDKDSVAAALGVLEERAWVRRLKEKSPATGGRPSEAWLINPKVVRHAV